MDELQLVRDFYGTPPLPGEDTVASARALLSEGAGPRRVPSRARHPHPRLVRYGVPAVAAAVAATVVTAVVVQGPARNAASPNTARNTGAPGTRAPSTGAPAARGSGSPTAPPAVGGLSVFSLPAGAAVGTPAGSGRQVLLTMARTVASVPQPVTGRYYVTGGSVGNFLPVGPASDPYVVLELSYSANWAARSPKDGIALVGQELGVELASPADQAAWQRDGSPTAWPDITQKQAIALPNGLPIGGSTRSLTTARGQLTPIDVGYGAQQFQIGVHNLTLAQLQALPADPAQLKALMGSGQDSYEDETDYLMRTVAAVVQMPVTPAVRAALYEMLAGLPGVVSLGMVTDVGGQQGEAVGYTGSYTDCGTQIDIPPGGGMKMVATFPTCSVQEVLIINPATGMPLAEELRYASLPSGANWSAPDDLFSYELFAAPYWTNDNRP
jgi:hypothetical protein